MVTAKRWHYAGHVARIWTSDPMPRHPQGMRVDFSTDDLESNDAGNNSVMTAGPRPASNGRRWRGTDLAQSRNVKDGDDATWM